MAGYFNIETKVRGGLPLRIDSNGVGKVHVMAPVRSHGRKVVKLVRKRRKTAKEEFGIYLTNEKRREEYNII